MQKWHRKAPPFQVDLNNGPAKNYFQKDDTRNEKDLWTVRSGQAQEKCDPCDPKQIQIATEKGHTQIQLDRTQRNVKTYSLLGQ